MIGLGSVFVAAGQQYGVDPRLVVAIAGEASAFSTDPADTTFIPIHNAWRWDDATGQPRSFDSWNSAIGAFTQYVATACLQQGQASLSSWVPSSYGGTCSSNCFCAGSDCSGWLQNVGSYYSQQGGNQNTQDLSYSGNTQTTQPGPGASASVATATPGPSSAQATATASAAVNPACAGL